jgi:hypothetical protein
VTRSVKSQHVDSTPYKRRRGAALYRYLPRVLQASGRALYVEQMFDDLAREVEAVEALPQGVTQRPQAAVAYLPLRASDDHAALSGDDHALAGRAWGAVARSRDWDRAPHRR